MTRPNLSWVMVGVLLLVSGPVYAQDLSDPACDDAAAPKPHVSFDHLKTNASQHYTISVRRGEPIVVCISQTALAGFSYSIAGVVKAVQAASPTGLVSLDDLGTRRLSTIHDDKYGGYLVAIKRKAPGAVTVAKSEDSTVELNDVMLVIAAETQKFQYEFAGAFTVSNLVDPQFAIESRPVDGQDTSFVVRDEDAEDTSRLGLGAFIHVFHDRLPWLAATFGIGIADTTRTTYFLGPTLRLGQAMALTAGPVWGSVTRLPSGIKVDTPAKDANVLTDLPLRTKRGWFFGLSYTFLQAKSALEKPFAPAEE